MAARKALESEVTFSIRILKIDISGVIFLPMPQTTTVEIINPNLHVLLIHTPIAMLVIGTLIELFSFLWRRSGFRAAGRWMILIGALATIPAVTTGMYAARQAMQGDPDATWTQLKQSAPFAADAWNNLTWHVRCNAIGAGISAILIVAWIGCSNFWRGKLHLMFLLLLLGDVGLFTFGAWNGGEMIYSHQIGTRLVQGGWPKNLSGDDGSKESASTQGSEAGSQFFGALNAGAAQVSKFDDMLDVHAFLAGCTIALALVTLGLSIRAISIAPRVPIDDSMARDEDIVQALTPHDSTMARSAHAQLMETADLPTDDMPMARVPSARFWLVTAFLALCTITAGWMVVGPESYHGAWHILQREHRDLVHGIAGASILLIALILALITRIAPTKKVLIACLAILLVAAIAIQVWLAFLLTFDGSGGPLNHIN